MTTFYKLAVSLGLAVLLVACSGKATDTSMAISIIDKKAISFLLDSAAGDFRLTSKQLPSDFKNVYFGQIFHIDGTKQNILCGEFFANWGAGSGAWADFATVQTIGYEQWLGVSSGQFCKHTEAKIHTKNDLTSEIKQRLK